MNIEVAVGLLKKTAIQADTVQSGSEALERMLLKYLPKEKVTMAEPCIAGSGEVTETAMKDERYNLLREADMIPETGLEYCQQDNALYESLLEEYALSAPEKAAALEAYYEEQNWKQYGILVHALKSTSRMIGAESLAKAAEALEKAAKEENGNYIIKHHAGTMSQYRMTAEAAGKLTGAVEQREPENEILEFPPME